jgi:hypothetical protein
MEIFPGYRKRVPGQVEMNPQLRITLIGCAACIVFRPRSSAFNPKNAVEFIHPPSAGGFFVVCRFIGAFKIAR